MKQGRTLQAVAVEVERQRKNRRDYIAPASRLRMLLPEVAVGDNSTPEPVIQGLGDDLYGLTGIGHDQLSNHLGIPRAYYNRMLTAAPELLVANTNHWLEADKSRHLVRTLDGRVRAILSDRYRPLDNWDLIDAALPILKQSKAEIVSSEITGLRLYIKATFPTMKATITTSKHVGDIVEAGLVVSNSEVGCGALKVEPMIYRLACLNGAIAGSALKKYHLGKALGDGDSIEEYLTTETKAADDRAFWLKARDVMRAAFDESLFRMLVAMAERAATEKVEGKLETVVENVTERFNLAGREDGIMKALIEGGDLSRWGMANAITAAAQAEDITYEQATEMERAGGKVIELAPSDWKVLAA